MKRPITRVSVNRARLHAGKSPIRVEFKGRMRHAMTVAVMGPCVLSAVRIRGKNVVLLVTESEVELVK